MENNNKIISAVEFVEKHIDKSIFVKDLAYEFRYNSPEAFSRVFKNYFSISPIDIVLQSLLYNMDSFIDKLSDYASHSNHRFILY